MQNRLQAFATIGLKSGWFFFAGLSFPFNYQPLTYPER
jgi:hypothetical protein